MGKEYSRVRLTMIEKVNKKFDELGVILKNITDDLKEEFDFCERSNIISQTPKMKFLLAMGNELEDEIEELYVENPELRRFRG